MKPFSEAENRLIRLGFWLFLGVTAMTFAGIALLVLKRPFIVRLSFPDTLMPILLGLVNGSIAFLIIRFQPRQAIGWFFMVIALPSALSFLLQTYAVYGFVAAPEAGLPGLILAAWVQKWLQFLAFPVPFALLFVLFPNGRLPSPKWRWILVVSALIVIIQISQAILSPGLIRIYISEVEIALPILNPTGVRRLPLLNQVLDLTWFLSLFTIVAGAASLFVRYRAADWVERQQLKWLVFLVIVFFLLFPITFFGGDTLLDDVAILLLIIMLPAGTAIAILRYQLYGIDLIIRRTVQYTLLTGILAAVYFSLVLILQSLLSGMSEEQSPIVLVISTLAIAALFNPLRVRILAFIDRRFFRSRYDAEQILQAFSETVRSEVDILKLSNTLLKIVSSTIRPKAVSLWIRTEPGFRKPIARAGDRSDG